MRSILVDQRSVNEMNLKMCESDYKFMSIIWNNEPVRSGRLVELCAKKLNWKKSTTYTTLKKVCDKGYAKNQNSIVSSTVKKSEVQEFESRHVIDEAFSGSLPNFLTAFFSGKKISNKEAEELKKLIDGYKE